MTDAALPARQGLSTLDRDMLQTTLRVHPELIRQPLLLLRILNASSLIAGSSLSGTTSP